MTGARGQHQIVVTDVGAIAQDHLARGGVHVRYFTQQHPHVVLVAKQRPDRGSDIGRRQTGGRHLIQQRLKQVVVALVDDRDPTGGQSQAVRYLDSTETGTDHHHMGHVGQRLVRPAFQQREPAGQLPLQNGVSGNRSRSAQRDQAEQEKRIEPVDRLDFVRAHDAGAEQRQHRADRS